MNFPKFNEYKDFDAQKLNTINPLFSHAFENFIFGLRIINQISDSWKNISPKIAARNASLDSIKKYKELTYSFDGPVAQCLFAFIRENVPKDGTYGKEYVNSQVGQKILQQFGWADKYKQDLSNLIKNDFLSNFNLYIIYTSYVISHQFSNLSQGQDSIYQLIGILPAFEKNFETIYIDLSEQISNEEDPYVAHDIAYGHKGRIHTKSEILYQCKENDESTGNEYIRRITINYKDPVTIYDIFNVYRDFYGSLHEFISEGDKVCKLIPIFNEYYEKPRQVFKEYIDKNFKFCLDIVQKVIPKYITENNSHNFYIDIENTCFMKEHKKIIQKMKNFFENAHIEADKKRAKIKASGEHNRDLEKLEPKMKDVKRYIDELKKLSKGEDLYQYEQARERLRSQIPELKKFKIKEAEDGIKEIERTLDETKKEESRFQMITFYEKHAPSINSILNLLREAIENKDVNVIAPYQNSVKEQLKSLDDDINKFEGDRQALKSFEPLQKLIEKANELLKVKIGGKSAECLQAENIYLMQVNAYLPSIDMMANMAPNPAMVTSLNMMKSQLNNLAQNLIPFKDESPEIKDALEKITIGITKLDEQIAKCSK